MSNEKMELIEKVLTANKVQEYEIYLTERKAYESIILKDKVDKERNVKSFDYVLRILDQRGDKTGIGIVKGNSIKSPEIEQNIKVCVKLSKINTSSKYYFPSKSATQKVSTFDKNIVDDPLNIKNDLVKELLLEIQQKRNVYPTFGRFRVHFDKKYLRNSNSINIGTQKTYFFIEFSLKAQKNGRLSEFWPYIFVKDRNQLDFPKRVKKWTKLAQDTLNAKLPIPSKDAIVIFPPPVLHDALNPVIGVHASGRAFHEKVSKFNINKPVASENISMYDDGLLEGCLAVNSWDGEGTPHQRNEIIKKGYFQKILFDQKNAILESKNSTGNGLKGIAGSIVNGISNLEISPGDITLDEMVSNIDEGYYIESFSDLNPSELTGAFGAEIRNGYYIKDGKIENPIKLGNVSGNILKMIKNCVYVSKEREFFANNLFPYMAFKNLTVSS
ncbi:MAG: TldD/PmbA family protein [Promethearchaeota archaeon]|jgi:predicted Zn-dependent protease